MSDSKPNDETENNYVVIPSFLLLIIVFFPIIFWGYADGAAANSRAGDECAELNRENQRVYRGMTNVSYSEVIECLEDHRALGYGDFGDAELEYYDGGNRFMVQLCCFPLLLLIFIFSRVGSTADGSWPDHIGPYFNNKGGYMDYRKNYGFKIKNIEIFVIIYSLNLVMMTIFFAMLNDFFFSEESADWYEHHEMLDNFDTYRLLIMVQAIAISTFIFLPLFADYENGFETKLAATLITNDFSPKVISEEQYFQYKRDSEQEWTVLPHFVSDSIIATEHQYDQIEWDYRASQWKIRDEE